ncbi:MAG: MarC family protein [Candidatus Omnitrophica bacterium]|jgi:multiple antibiotic resistance protein|nr:MarC family protein [Candidatus Omnitrophota bacterium]
MKGFLPVFIPLFVAVDAIGVLPIFASLTDGLSRVQKRKIIIQSMITACCLAIGFIFLGKATFRLLNITVSDFMIAGGTVLFSIAILDILNPEKNRRIPGSQLGAVPLGTPLIAGPAVLTTSLVMLENYGISATLLSVIINIALAGTIFFFSGALIKTLGVAGSRALSKIMNLLLAAIAVMMIRKGLMALLA